MQRNGATQRGKRNEALQREEEGETTSNREVEQQGHDGKGCGKCARGSRHHACMPVCSRAVRACWRGLLMHGDASFCH